MSHVRSGLAGETEETNSEAGSLSNRTKGNINVQLGSLSVIEVGTERNVYAICTCVYISLYKHICIHTCINNLQELKLH